MDEQMKRKADIRRDQLYLAVKNMRPELYEKVVAVASTCGLPLGAASRLEHRMMGLVAEAAEIEALDMKAGL